MSTWTPTYSFLLPCGNDATVRVPVQELLVASATARGLLPGSSGFKKLEEELREEVANLPIVEEL